MESQAPKEASQPAKSSKIRTSRRCQRVDLGRIKKQLLTVLARDSGHLMDASQKGKLGKDDSAALTGYLKTVKELLMQDAKESEGMSEEDLARLAGEK